MSYYKGGNDNTVVEVEGLQQVKLSVEADVTEAFEVDQVYNDR